MKQRGRGGRIFPYVVGSLSSIVALLFGYDVGIMSTSMIIIREEFHLSKSWQQIIVSSTVAAAAVFSLFAGYLNDAVGRRKTVLFAALLHIIGTVLMGTSINQYMLVVGRLIIGAAIGMASMTCPLYVAETSPPEIRGRLVSLIQIFFTSGALSASLIAGAFSGIKKNSWKYMLGIGAIPSITLFMGFFYLPESPRILVMKGKLEQAENVLQRILKGSQHHDVQQELKNIIRTTEENRKPTKSGLLIVRRMVRTPHVRRAMFVGIGLFIFQQLCGINAVIYYSASILQMAGFPDNSAIWLTCIPNVVNLLCSSTGIYFMDKVGRRTMLIVSMTGMTLACLVLASGFQLQHHNTPPINLTAQLTNYPKLELNSSCFHQTKCDSCISANCGFCFLEKQDEDVVGSCLPIDEDANIPGSMFGSCLNVSTRNIRGVKWAPNYCPTDLAWITVVGVALYILCFAPGMGSLPWTINSEIYPLWARSTGNSLGAAIHWATCLTVSFTFLTFLDVATKHGAFYTFAGICLTGTIFFALFVPETRNKSLEEIEESLLSKHKKEKDKLNVQFEVKIDG